jgi:signal transduction histidine kinase
MVKQRFIGGLLIYHSETNHYSDEQGRLALTFANHAALAIENARLYRQAQTSAVSAERSRLARELHDSVSQELYSLNLYAGATKQAMRSGKLDAAEKNLDELVEIARHGMNDLRLLIFELRPSILDKEGLISALKIRMETVETRSGIPYDIYVEGEPQLSSEVEQELYWCVHEALNNTLKHAHAGFISLELLFKDDSTEIIVTDDGDGFDLSKLEHSIGLGMKNIAERMAKIGGTYNLESQPGQGTTLKLTVPG